CGSGTCRRGWPTPQADRGVSDDGWEPGGRRACLVTSIEARPDPIRTWILAIRPPTLTAAVAPVVVGSAVAVREHAFSAGPALAALLGALAIQAGANLANDLSDFRRGADTVHRLGPPRVTQRGLLTEAQVVAGIVVAFAVATL